MRERLIENNKELSSTAKQAGVRRYDVFQNEGYKGMYGGMGLGEVAFFKGVPKDQLLDRIGPAELAAHDFRVTQTQIKLKRESIQTETAAVAAHRTVGANVRQAMINNENVVPEHLAVEDSIHNEIARRQRQKKKQLTAARQLPKP